MEKQNILQAVSLGHQAFLLYRGSGFILVLLYPGSIPQTSSAAQISQALP